MERGVVEPWKRGRREDELRMDQHTPSEMTFEGIGSDSSLDGDDGFADTVHLVAPQPQVGQIVTEQCAPVSSR